MRNIGLSNHISEGLILQSSLISFIRMLEALFFQLLDLGEAGLLLAILIHGLRVKLRHNILRSKDLAIASLFTLLLIEL